MGYYEEVDEARKTLELGETATLQEIKDSYRKLVLNCHPDRTAGKKKKEAEDTFKEITSAYDVIMDYCARYRYSFREEDVDTAGAEKKMDEEHLKNFYDGWFGDIDS